MKIKFNIISFFGFLLGYWIICLCTAIISPDMFMKNILKDIPVSLISGIIAGFIIGTFEEFLK